MINTIKVGMFASASITDSEGTFSYEGIVTKVSVKNEQVALDCSKYSTNMTTLVAPIEDITILTAEPTLVERQAPITVAEDDAKPTKVKATPSAPKTKGPSENLQKVINIVKANPDLKRKQYIEMICKEMTGKTEAFASTYLHNAKAYL